MKTETPRERIARLEKLLKETNICPDCGERYRDHTPGMLGGIDCPGVVHQVMWQVTVLDDTINEDTRAAVASAEAWTRDYYRNMIPRNGEMGQ